MRAEVWKRRGAAFLVTAGLLIATAPVAGTTQATSGLNHYRDADGHNYVTGCVTFELAEHLVANAGFEYGSAGAPAFILCTEGYTQVGKKLN